MLKRFLSLYIFFIFCFMVLLGRIFYIAKTDYTEVTSRQSTRTVTVGEKRGEIYDRNFTPLVNSEKKLLAVVTPCVASYEYLKGMADEKYLKEKIENGSPFIIEVNEEIDTEFIRTFRIPERHSADPLAVHLVGYTSDNGSVGVTGIEGSYNNYLTENSGKLTVSFQVDAVGRVLAGMDKYINDSGFSSKAGVVLTLDSDIQKLTEIALKNSKIKSGCILILKAHTGEILSLASVPEYDPNNVSDSLAAENSPFVNKAIMSYSVGSIFKPMVAASAMENGITPLFEYECKGEITIGDRTFKCYNNKAHGKLDMTKALEVSCNTYFINLIMKVDIDHLLNLCSEMGLGNDITLAPLIKSSMGTLPTRDSLGLKGNLANFAFGQGDFSASPLQIASAYHALSTGNSVSPNLVMGFTNYMGLMTKEPVATQRKVLSDKTVLNLRKMLANVAKAYGLEGSAGKTGTAQSGVYKNGKEFLRTWFAGFYPAVNPEYIVIVMNENGKSGTSDCLPVFGEIIKAMTGR